MILFHDPKKKNQFFSGFWTLWFCLRCGFLVCFSFYSSLDFVSWVSLVWVGLFGFFPFFVSRQQFLLHLHLYSISQIVDRLTNQSQRHPPWNTPEAQMTAREKAFTWSFFPDSELSTYSGSPTFQSHLLQTQSLGACEWVFPSTWLGTSPLQIDNSGKLFQKLDFPGLPSLQWR